MTAAAVRAGTTNSTGQAFLAAAIAVTALPWVAGLVAASMPVPGERQMLVVLGVWLALPHVASSAAMYADPELRPMLTGARYRLVPVVAVVGCAAVASIGPAGIDLLLIVNSLWALHHFAKQNLGMVSFVQRARRQPGPSPLDRKVVVATGVAAMFGYQAILLPKLGYQSPALFQTAGLVILAGCAVVALRSPARGPMLAASVFFLPLFLGLPVGQATVVYGAAHGAQYLLMMGAIARPSRQVGVVLVVSVVAGGYLLTHGAGMAPWIAGAVVGINLAHFVIDAGVWKMTTPEKRAYMRERFGFL